MAGLASPRTTNEALASFKRFFADVLKSKQVGLLDGAVPPLDLGAAATLRRSAGSRIASSWWAATRCRSSKVLGLPGQACG